MPHPKNILNYFTSVFCAFILTDTLHAQISTSIPQWVNKIGIEDIGVVNKKQVKDGYHYVMVDEQYHTVKKHNYFHYAISAITEEALTNVSQIEFSYDPTYEKALLHFVKIHRGNQVIDKTSTLELKELDEESERKNGILNGKKTIYTNLSDIRKGDIIEYGYSIIGENPIMKDYFTLSLWFSYSVPVGKINMRVLFAKEIKPTILKTNITIDPLIKISDVNDYTWQVKNPKVITIESSTPAWYNPYDKIQITNFKTWNEVKDHCRSLVNIPGTNFPSLKKIVDSIVQLSPDLEKQISSIVDFVQTHVRYSGNENGIYSHVPRNPETVLKNLYGDCKEKSVLLNKMLNLIHVEAYPVLINTSIGKKVIDQAPSINAFDHCISSFIFEGKNYFIDPTITYQRGSFKLRVVPSYETGMILNNKKEPFETIPPNLQSKTSILEEFFIEESGNTRLKVTSRYSGASADETRYLFLVNSLYDVQDSYRNFYTKYTDDIEVIDTVVYVDNDVENEFIVTEHYYLNNFWTVKDSSKSKIISKDFLPYSLHYRLNYGEENKRKQPLRVYNPASHTQTISIIKDGGWNIPDQTVKEDNEFFTYTYSSKVTDTKIDILYDFAAKKEIIEAKDYLDYKSKMDFIDKNLVFSTEEKPLTEGILGFNWLLLLLALSGMAFAAVLAWHLYKRPFYTPYVNQYDSIGGWLIIVGIGVTINPFVLLFSIYTEYNDEMGVNYLVYFFNENSPYFSPLRGYFTLFVDFFNSLLFVGSILILILFYQKKSSFRLYFALFRIGNVVFLILNVILLNIIYSDSTNLEERKILGSETSGMMRVFIQACIWVPYVWYSERSRHTFTVDSKPASFENVAEPFHSTENQSTGTDPVN